MEVIFSIYLIKAQNNMPPIFRYGGIKKLTFMSLMNTFFPKQYRNLFLFFPSGSEPPNTVDLALSVFGSAG